LSRPLLLGSSFFFFSFELCTSSYARWEWRGTCQCVGGLTDQSMNESLCLLHSSIKSFDPPCARMKRDLEGRNEACLLALMEPTPSSSLLPPFYPKEMKSMRRETIQSNPITRPSSAPSFGGTNKRGKRRRRTVGPRKDGRVIPPSQRLPSLFFLAGVLARE